MVSRKRHKDDSVGYRDRQRDVAPVAPWFTSANAYPSGAYVKVHQETGTGIDFYSGSSYVVAVLS